MENEMIKQVFLVEYQRAIEARDTLEDQTPYTGNWKQAAHVLQRKVRTWLGYLQTLHPMAFKELEPLLEKITGKYEEAKLRFMETYEKDESCPLEMDNYEQNIAFRDFLRWKYQLQVAEKVCMDKNLI